MDIGYFLNTDSLVPELKATTKEEAIKELIDKVFENRAVRSYFIEKERVSEEVIKRESLQSTGIGQGLAFPHARIEGWGEFVVAMGISKNGIDFASVDKIPARYVFLMISSVEQPYVILQTMGAIIKFLTQITDGTSMLEDLTKLEETLEVRGKAKKEHEEEVTAADIVQPIEDVVNLDMEIENVIDLMHLKRIDILAVVDEKNRFCGEISCFDIFEYGAPDFFKQLKTVSFIKYVDPFEKYFKLKKNLKVKDIYKKEELAIKKDRTLIELVFDMTVRRRSKLFIVNDDGTLLGYIDRFSIIDKILFF